ncbi:MAG TPA: LPXTG cell wall anchor domain-containing protein [Gemmataceae bacterium]|nr:LPXTG cell wall anchor domain-containing protein [Gemmataceae bacterium]
MKRPIVLSLLLVLGLAAAAAGQTGKSLQYSNAPTDTDYRMTIVEPKAGATIVGKDVNIVLGLPAMPQGNRSQSQASDLKQREMNTPIFQIWVDDKNMGNLPGGQNVFYARDLSYGPHKIVVMAKNASGELVDRKEISVTTVEKTASVAMTQSAAPAPPPEPAPAPRAEVYSPPPAPAPAAPIETTLPHTATRQPLAALAGLLLLAGGLVLRRKS